MKKILKSLMFVLCIGAPNIVFGADTITGPTEDKCYTNYQSTGKCSAYVDGIISGSKIYCVQESGTCTLCPEGYYCSGGQKNACSGDYPYTDGMGNGDRSTVCWGIVESGDPNFNACWSGFTGGGDKNLIKSFKKYASGDCNTIYECKSGARKSGNSCKPANCEAGTYWGELAKEYTCKSCPTTGPADKGTAQYTKPGTFLSQDGYYSDASSDSVHDCYRNCTIEHFAGTDSYIRGYIVDVKGTVYCDAHESGNYLKCKTDVAYSESAVKDKRFLCSIEACTRGSGAPTIEVAGSGVATKCAPCPSGSVLRESEDGNRYGLGCDTCEQVASAESGNEIYTATKDDGTQYCACKTGAYLENAKYCKYCGTNATSKYTNIDAFKDTPPADKDRCKCTKTSAGLATYKDNDSEDSISCTNVCQVGYYCANDMRHKCTPGTYQDKTGQTSCKNAEGGKFTEASKNGCDANKYGCKGVSTCAIGHYCPGYSSSDSSKDGLQHVCPKGTYQNGTGMSTCYSVPAGHYATGCNGDGTKCTGIAKCRAGNYCLGGEANNSSKTGVETKCPGPMTSAEGSDGRDDCSYTTKPNEWLNNNTCELMTPCIASHYCPGSIKVTANATGEPCPPEKNRGVVWCGKKPDGSDGEREGRAYCPAGATENKYCDDDFGKYMVSNTDRTACETCKAAEGVTCPAGQFACEEEDKNITPKCVTSPPGYYSDGKNLYTCPSISTSPEGSKTKSACYVDVENLTFIDDTPNSNGFKLPENLVIRYWDMKSK